MKKWLETIEAKFTMKKWSELSLNGKVWRCIWVPWVSLFFMSMFINAIDSTLDYTPYSEPRSSQIDEPAQEKTTRLVKADKRKEMVDCVKNFEGIKGLAVDMCSMEFDVDSNDYSDLNEPFSEEQIAEYNKYKFDASFGKKEATLACQKLAVERSEYPETVDVAGSGGIQYLNLGDTYKKISVIFTAENILKIRRKYKIDCFFASGGRPETDIYLCNPRDCGLKAIYDPKYQ